MNIRLCEVAFLVVSAVPVCGQERPTFEVASIKRIADYEPTATMNGELSHGRLTLNNAHLAQMISVAYGIQYVRIHGVPAWFSENQFQVAAKAEDPTTSDGRVKVMLQNLLADRFRLRFHWEDRPLSNFTLRTAAGGPKLDRAPEDGVDNCARSMNGTRHELTCTHIQIGTLANALATMLGSPVVDQTGLAGNYDFTLNWDGDDMYSAVPDALEQFGLKLEMKKVPTRVFVIDSVERPSEN
jgi:uncharacterized protein (TIGR03435 family)